MKNSVIVFKSPYLRTSYQKTGKEVSEIIKETLPNTIYLSITSILIAIVIGLFFGILSALNKDNFLDIIKFYQTISKSDFLKNELIEIFYNLHHTFTITT